MNHVHGWAGSLAPLAFFTICSKNFLAYARTLAASVREHHPGARVYVALCDRLDDMVDPANEPFELLALESLSIPGIEGMIERYNITELNTSIKPFVFEHLFAERGESRVVYLDPDILVVSPLADVDARLGADIDAVLTPHVLDPAEDVEIDDVKMLLLGVYNLGFVALHDTPRVRAIVAWWGRRLREQCVIDVPNGLFVDQKWANLLVSYIPRTLVLHHPGYNVAYWNLPQRRVAHGAGGWTVNGQPLVFAHFSGNDLDNPAVFSRHSPRLAPEVIGEAAALLAEYRTQVFAQGHAHYRQLPYAFRWNGASGRNEHTPEPVQMPAQEAHAPAPSVAWGARLPARRSLGTRARDAWTTLARARRHAGGWGALVAKAAGVVRRGGMPLVRATVRELNVRQGRLPMSAPARSSMPMTAPAIAAPPPAAAAAPDVEALVAARLQEAQAHMEQACEARVQRARDETAARWSHLVLQARADATVHLARDVQAMFAQVSARWSDQLAANVVAPPPPLRAAAMPSAPAGEAPRGRLPRVAVMSHDAQAHGAQYLALSLVREYAAMGVHVETLMNGPGWLEPRFEALAPMHRLYEMDAGQLHALGRDLRARGIDLVIANTSVCGARIMPFRDAGLPVVALIHELPQLIAHYGLEQSLATLAEAADCLVVPSDAVLDGLISQLGEGALAGKVRMRHQGLYTRNRYRGLPDMGEARTRLRQRAGFPPDALVALCVGYADLRKGADLLAEAAIHARRRDPRFHVLWVGHTDPELQARIEASLAAEGMQGLFHFAGLDFDTDDYFAGADVYALSSREDPFPTVVMEALAVGTPVVAFVGTGGCADLVARKGGAVVPAFDVAAYGDALLRIATDPAERARHGAEGVALIDRDFGFRTYALDLVNMRGAPVPPIATVSAVVPTYNYACHLPERIATVAAQSHPVGEIIVLDDASTDNSIEVLRAIRLHTHPEPLLVARTTNSGSVFRQWLDGVRRARSEYVWIAEADDAADPALLAQLLPAMEADPAVVMAYAQSARVDVLGQVMHADYLGYTDDLDAARWRAAYTATGAEEAEASMAVKNTVPNVSAVLFRREPLLAVLEANIDTIARYRVAGDWVTYLLLLQRGKIHYQPAVLNRHRYHARSVTGALDHRRHLEEVMDVQRMAGTMFNVSRRTRDAAAAYAEGLRRHFGLDAPPPTH